MSGYDSSSGTADVSLLRGLEPAMSLPEQESVAAMMVSGDPNELARAARVLADIGTLLRHGIVPGRRSADHDAMIANSFRAPMVAPPTRNKPSYNDYEARVERAWHELREDTKARARNLPLPVRMPRCVTIGAFDRDGKKPPLEFVDDTWDGTLGAAFCKLSVVQDHPPGLRWLLPHNNHGAVRVEHELKPSPGFDAIVNLVEKGYEEPLAGTPEPRVLVAAARHDAAKAGLRKGDVVTHVNGEEFFGTAADLRQLIGGNSSSPESAPASSSGSRLELVVNAERCVAQALRLRSFHQQP